MKVTKQEHACLVIEQDDRVLVIDPGSFTTPLDGIRDVVAVVITHEHADHWTADQLERIQEFNPKVRIFGPEGVAKAAENFKVETVKPGDKIEVEPFRLEFFGGKHAVIHKSIPIVDNVGVLVNGELYYAGDSFTVPTGVEVGTLAAPAGAPWLKIGEVIDFVIEVAPKRSFAVHEMVLSTAGKQLSNARIKFATESGGGEFFPLEPGQSIEI